MADISENDARVFIDAVTHYFAHLTGEPAVIRSAYLADATLPRFDYTGLITLSGQFRGCVYFSASKLMTTKLLIALNKFRRQKHVFDYADLFKQHLEAIILLYSESDSVVA